MRLTAAVLVLCAGLVTACGVGPEGEPRALPQEAASVVAVPTPATDQPRAGLLVELWFVADNRLVPVNRTAHGAMSQQEKLDALKAGPTAAELAVGMRTAVTSLAPDRPLVQTAEAADVPVGVASGEVAVVLGDDFGALPSQEQLFILGQVVMSLASEPGTSVVFVDSSGRPVGVPLPNGRLTSGAVSAPDYVALID